MFKKEKKDNEVLNYRRLNELIRLSSKFMKLIYTLTIVTMVFIGIHLLKELHILKIIKGDCRLGYGKKNIFYNTSNIT